MSFKRGTLRVFSKHPSHSIIRNLIETERPTLLRLGSTTPWDEAEIELNTIDSIKNCSDKLKMKDLFWQNGIKSPNYFAYIPNRKQFIICLPEQQAKWLTVEQLAEEVKFPIIAKRSFRSRGAGMEKIDDLEQLEAFIQRHITANTYNQDNPYYFEEYANFTREYRVHCSSLGGYFYSCRKLIKDETPQDERWYRNDSNCNWVTETHSSFNRPETMDAIVADCNKALGALGLDIGGFDVRVNKEGDWRIIEANSACSFSRRTPWKYADELTKLIIQKENELECAD